MVAEVMGSSKVVTDLGDSQRDTKEEAPKKPDEDSSDYDSDLDESIKEELRKYQEDLVKYEGFLIKNLPSVGFFGAIHPINVDGQDRKYIREFTQFAIDKHNSEKNDDLELVEITRCNMKLSGAYFCYITFDAIHSSKPEEKKSYQTEVHCLMGSPDPGEEEITVEVFREDRLADMS